MSAWWQALRPARAAVGQRERLRAGGGALIGILLTGLIGALLIDAPMASAWLVAPMAASAVLLFCVPASPLTQPWSMVAGNVVGAVVGIACARFIPFPLLAAAVALFVAIGSMFALRCLHPPSGAVALTAVLGGPEVHALGWSFAWSPVLLNSLVLVLVAVLYNRATGRRYPHSQQAEPVNRHQTVDPLPNARLGFSAADLQAVLKEYDQVLDVSPDDLVALFHQTERHALRRRLGATRCGDIMSRDVLTVAPTTSLADCWQRMQVHDVRALPVVDASRHVVGIVTRSDFLAAAGAADPLRMLVQLRGLLRTGSTARPGVPQQVEDIMTREVQTVTDSTPMLELVPRMSDEGLHHVPVIDERQRLVGMVTQSDLVAGLYQKSLAQFGESEAAARAEAAPAVP